MTRDPMALPVVEAMLPPVQYTLTTPDEIKEILVYAQQNAEERFIDVAILRLLTERGTA